MSHENDSGHEPVGYGVYFMTWFSLLVLTAVTVTAAGMHFGNLSVMVALVIASIKAGIVLFIFMHLKYETKLFHWMLLVLVVTIAIFVGLTFTDTLFR